MKNKARVHDIVQVNSNHKWCGNLIYVTEVKSFGIQGFAMSPLEGCAYIRLTEDQYEVIGPAVLRVTLDEE